MRQIRDADMQKEILAVCWASHWQGWAYNAALKPHERRDFGGEDVLKGNNIPVEIYK